MLAFLVPTLLYSFLLWIVIFYLTEFWNNRKSPPGPLRLPVIGTFFQVALKHPLHHIALSKLASKYGEVYSVSVGKVRMVILSSLEAAKTVLTKNEAMGRHPHWLESERNQNQTLGIALASGEKWSTMRSWTIRKLREFGLGKIQSTSAISDLEIDHLVAKLDDLCTSSGSVGIFDVSMAFSIPVLNVLWVMMTGSRILDEDAKLQKLLKESDECFKATGITKIGMMEVFPWVASVFPDMSGYNASRKFFNSFFVVAKEILQEHRATKGSLPYESENLLDCYIQQMELEKDDPNTLFTEDNFAILFEDLFQGGSETTSGFLEFFILFMVLNPKAQDKLHQEISTVLKNGIRCTSDHQSRMLYTQAVLLETHRHAELLPNLIARKALKDFEYKNFTIKKDTVILTDLHTLYTNEPTWGPDSGEFRPERFLSSDNQKIINADKIMPFSVGKRNCPGESLATVSSFLFAVSLIQKFKFSVIEGEPNPTIVPFIGFSLKPQSFRVNIEKRQMF